MVNIRSKNEEMNYLSYYIEIKEAIMHKVVTIGLHQ